MTIKKPAIPSVASLPPALGDVLRPIKENIELITGVRGAPLPPLPANATLDQVVVALNALIARINATGA